MFAPCVPVCPQEEMKAQLPRYQRLLPRPGQAHAAAPPVAAVGGIMPPQQGIPPQQPGMRHPMHGENLAPRAHTHTRTGTTAVDSPPSHLEFC